MRGGKARAKESILSSRWTEACRAKKLNLDERIAREFLPHPVIENFVVPCRIDVGCGTTEASICVALSVK
jgi:hypothetical protein